MIQRHAVRGIVALIVLVTVLVGVVPSCTRSGMDGRGAGNTNVVLITLDTTRADHLGCYGYGRGTSPRIDRLAEDAVRFDMAISTSAITPISHASILTGLNPDRHGLRVFYGPTGHRLRDDPPTLASILGEAGWSTAAFISAFSASERFGLHRGFETFRTELAEQVMRYDPAKPRPREGYFLRERTASAQRRADDTTDQALAWLAEAPRPFFTWIHYFDPHDPWLVPPEEITERFGAGPEHPDAFRAIYDPEIFFMDQQLGRVLDRLVETGEYERTIIVVVADHGQGLGDHGWFAHRLLYQEQIRVPLIIRLPGEKQGTVVSEVVRIIDVMPTILDALGIAPSAGVQGLGLGGLMRGETEPPRSAYAEALNTIDTHTPPMLPPFQRDLLFSLVRQDWKLIHHRNEPGNSELYNLREDPGELRNLANEFPAQAARLVEALEASGAMTIREVEPESPIDPEALEKLRSLGYVGGG